MRLLLFISICSTLSFVSCKKKELEYEISGVVTDASFNTPKANCKVIISAKKNGDYYTLTTLTTDASGTYSYQLKRELLTNVKIVIEAENYFGDQTETTLENLSLKEVNTFNYSIYAKSWVRLRFLSDGTKKLKYYKQEGKNGCSECCPAGETLVDYATDTSIYCINNGNSNYKILYTVVGEGTTGTPSVFTTPFDTTEMIISY